jgi:DNA polymerase-1
MRFRIKVYGGLLSRGDIMSRIVFDIEANGLTEIMLDKKGNVTPAADKVHCLVTMDVDTEEINTYGPGEIEEGVNKLREADLLIGHNIIQYDLTLLKRLYGEIDVKVFDTLVVSRLMYPDKTQHPFGGNSLACWGYHLGCQKFDYDGGWDAFNYEMLEYCVRDVKLNSLIYLEQLGWAFNNPKLVKFEFIVTQIIAEQTENGFGFDFEKGKKLYLALEKHELEVEEYFKELFPPIVEQRWSDKTGNRLKDKITIFNPGSRKQIAHRLQEKYGWVPPVTEKGNPKLDEAVLKELEYPEAKKLVQYFYNIKLKGQLLDWLKRAKNSRDGRIHGGLNPQGTVTGRMTASQPNMQQVSSDPLARALFKPREGWVQVGIDASGLEARMLGNRMAFYDGGEYGRIVVEEDVHAVNQAAAGLQSRSQAKTFFYGFIYGAGDAKVGKIINKSAFEGRKLKKRFLTRLPALRKVIEECKFQVNKTGKITLLDGRQVPCRSIHAALNVQLQGDGAVIMKLAQCILHRKLKSRGLNEQAKFMATVHDEWQLECEPLLGEVVGQLGVDSIKEAGLRLDCTVPLDGEYRIGENWSECH